jgi:hypothetical protein
MDHSRCRLIIDAGQNHFCFAVQEMDTGEFLSLEYYQFSTAQQDELRKLIDTDPTLRCAYPEVHVFYNHSRGLLVPDTYYQPDNAGRLLELMRGDLPSGPPAGDAIPEMGATYVYSVLPELHDMLAHKYPNLSFSHFNTGWLRRRSSLDIPSSRLEAVLYPSHLIVTLWSEGRLLVNQYYDYDTPEDVAWCLLNVARQWGMPPGDLPVVISGLVESHSPMYAEIRKYFIYVELDTWPSQFRYDPAFEQYPQHFFSPIFSLAT